MTAKRGQPKQALLPSHITTHLPLSTGALGFWDFSISSMRSSKALATQTS